MIIWIDAQLSPHLAPWLRKIFQLEASSVKHLGLRDASDHEIFESARKDRTVVMTKDRDFVRMLERRGPPPQVLWITAGYTGNVALKTLLQKALPHALALLEQGDALVEIREVVRGGDRAQGTTRSRSD